MALINNTLIDIYADVCRSYLWRCLAMHQPRKSLVARTRSGDQEALREARAWVEGVQVAGTMEGQPLLVCYHVVVGMAEIETGVALEVWAEVCHILPSTSYLTNSI